MPLQVIADTGRQTSRGHNILLVRCSCGITKEMSEQSLSRDKMTVTSCGCLIKTSTYKSWAAMIQRCNNPKNASFSLYGGRGISVSPRWVKSFLNFLEDMKTAPKGMTLDRKDVNGNYNKRNCRWATRAEQARNKRNTKLRHIDVLLIRSSKDDNGFLAIKYKVDSSTISRIKTGRRWNLAA
jgi:hypothetical protein